MSLATVPDTSAQRVLTFEKGSVVFSSDAPLELISATSKELKGRLDVEKKFFAFAVAIRSFNGFNSALQKEHFNENYLESDRFPTASFSGKIIEDVDLSKDGIITVRAKGNFTVHGVTQERVIRSELRVAKGIISLHSKFVIKLADHQIAIPKVVHEKLASEINVEVNAQFSSP